MFHQVLSLPTGLSMSIAATWPQCLSFFGTPLVIEPSPGQLSSDAGLLPIRYFDQRMGFAPVFVRTIDDPCNPDRTKHRFLEIVGARTMSQCDGSHAIGGAIEQEFEIIRQPRFLQGRFDARQFCFAAMCLALR